jgi:hypothetical protein
MLFVADCIRLIAANTLPTLEGFGDFKRGVKVIRILKYSDDLCYWLRKKRCYRVGLLD